MNFQTRGRERLRLKSSVVQQIFALRKDGYTCSQIAKMTNTGESTVARYTSDWYQKQRKSGFVAHRGVLSKTQEVHIAAAEAPEPEPKKAKLKKAAPEVKHNNPPTSNQLSAETIEYINKIYQSRNFAKGTFLGNLFIRIGKFFGGHDSV